MIICYVAGSNWPLQHCSHLLVFIFRFYLLVQFDDKLYRATEVNLSNLWSASLGQCSVCLALLGGDGGRIGGLGAVLVCTLVSGHVGTHSSSYDDK